MWSAPSRAKRKARGTAAITDPHYRWRRASARLYRPLANVDPFGAGQFRHAARLDPHGRVGRARSRNHLIEWAQRFIAEDADGRWQPERADAADRMTGDRQDRKSTRLNSSH